MRPATSVLHVYQTDDCDIVTFPAEVDLLNDQKIRTQLLWLLNSSPRGLILDLSKTRFCAACGVDAIFRACIRARALGIRVGLLSPPSGPVNRIIQITGLNRTIPTTSDRAEALAALHRARDDFPAANTFPAADTTDCGESRPDSLLDEETRPAPAAVMRSRRRG